MNFMYHQITFPSSFFRGRSGRRVVFLLFCKLFVDKFVVVFCRETTWLLWKFRFCRNPYRQKSASCFSLMTMLKRSLVTSLVYCFPRVTHGSDSPSYVTALCAVHVSKDRLCPELQLAKEFRN